MKTFEQRLMSRISLVPSGCMEWQGYRNPQGYGQIGRAGKLVLTHRAAYELANGSIGRGLVVRHRCDNPPCCNPEHLIAGTVAENSADAMERGQVARGFALPHTRLTPEQVVEIRAAYLRFTTPGRSGYQSNKFELAAKYGVTPKYIVAVAGRQERSDV